MYNFVCNFVCHLLFLDQSVWLPELKREPFLIFLIAIMTCETSAKSLQIIIAIMQATTVSLTIEAKTTPSFFPTSFIYSTKETWDFLVKWNETTERVVH